MAQSKVEIAKDLTLTLIEAGRLSSEDMHEGESNDVLELRLPAIDFSDNPLRATHD